jgi:hypothetical protein
VYNRLIREETVRQKTLFSVLLEGEVEVFGEFLCSQPSKTVPHSNNLLVEAGRVYVTGRSLPQKLASPPCSDVATLSSVVSPYC